MNDPNGTLPALLVAAVVLLVGGLMVREHPSRRRVGRWAKPPQPPVKHDDLALAVLIALAVVFCLLAKP